MNEASGFLQNLVGDDLCVVPKFQQLKLRIAEVIWQGCGLIDLGKIGPFQEGFLSFFLNKSPTIHSIGGIAVKHAT